MPQPQRLVAPRSRKSQPAPSAPPRREGEQPPRAWLSGLSAPVDAASLAVFRICFGLAMLWHVLEYLLGGRLERQYLARVFFFKFAGFEWIQPGSPAVLRALFAGLATAALLIALGLFYRLAAALFCLGITYVFLLDVSDYQNHTYLICLLSFLMILVPAHRALSLDTRRRPGLRSSVVPAWALWLLRFQVALPYVFGGLAKLNADWLLRAQPMRLWIAEGTEGAWGRVLPASWGPWGLTWGGTLFDLLIVPALLWRRTRVPAFVLCLGFHLLNSQLFKIGIFPWLMIAATFLFLPPDWPRRFHLIGPARKAGEAGKRAGKSPSPISPVSPISPALLGLLAVWVALQLLLPVRHVLYPGNVDWTEEGHAFSWRMKLRDKRGPVRFTAVDPAGGRTYPLTGIEAALTDRQRRMMVHDPEMIRQFAHFVAARLQQAGYGRLQVRAETEISFNGRPPQPLVDPSVDLAAQPRSLGHAPWIAPLRE